MNANGRHNRLLLIAAIELVVALAALQTAHVLLMRAHDDGCLYLQLPKNLVEGHRWAVERAEGLTDFDTKIAVGPATLLPVALAFKLFGVGLLQARLCMTAYFLAAVALWGILAWRLAGPTAGVLALAGFLFVPEIFLISTPAMGETPGLAWLALAFLLYLRWTRREGKVGLLFLAGLACGGAYLAKCVYGYLMAPAWVLVFLVSAIRRGKVRWAELIAPLAGMAVVFLLYYGVIFLVLGPRGAVGYALSIREFSRFADPQSGMVARVLYKLRLARDWMPLALAAAALVWVFARALDRNDPRGKQMLPIGALALVWTGWWFFANPISFYYHFFPAVVLYTVLSACLVARAIDLIRRSDAGEVSLRASLIVLLIAVFLWPWGNLRGQFANLALQRRLRSEQVTMLEVVRKLPADALLSGWTIFRNWDFVFLADRPTWGRPAEPGETPREEYLLMGPENIRAYSAETMRPTGFNPHSQGCARFVRERCRLVAQHGHFVLWRVVEPGEAEQGR